MSLTRRHFVRGSMLAASSLALPLSLPRKVLGANEQVRVAVIGARGRGQTMIEWVMDVAQKTGHVKLVALCDCDSDVLEKVASANEKNYNIKLERIKDFRTILDRKDIDAVCVSTPNHWHSLMAILAVQSGKDVYCEKPVSHNVWEGRQLVNAARKYNKIVQTGTQSRSSFGLQEAKKFIDSGELGKIQYAIGTCYKPRMPIGKLSSPLAIPASVDYDLWCGPAAKRDLFRPQLHYDWHWDFNTGNGDLGNQGIHQMDIARWMVGHTALSPKVVALGTRTGYDDASDTPHTQLVCHLYDTAPILFDVRGMPGSKAAQADPKTWQNKMDDLRGARMGVIVQCEGGSVVIGSYNSGTAFDKEGKKVKSFNGAGDHMGNFFQAVRSRKRETLAAEIEQGHLSSALCHTGNISYRLGRKMSADEIAQRIKAHPAMSEAFARVADHLKANEVDLTGNAVALGPWLEMDPKTERFTNNDAANKLLTREYRKPFVVPDLSV